MFEFPTYIVTKLYEEYHEDHLVVENNLNMSGGLFKSPTSSPTHERKASLQSKPAANNRQLDFARNQNAKLTQKRNRDLVVPAIQITGTDKKWINSRF